MSEHIERLLRDRPEWAGRLMEGGQMTWLEHRFYCDDCFVVPKWERYYRWLKDGNDPEAWRVDLP